MARPMLPPDTEYKVTPLSGKVIHWRNAFDSRFLRVFALNGKQCNATIAKVEQLKQSSEKTGESKQQLLVTLKEFEKPWAINVTNCETIESMHGVDPRGWVGKRITLYPTKTRDPGGKGMVDCIRVRESAPDDAPAQEHKPKHRQEVYQYLTAMKEATTRAALQALNASIGADTALEDPEVALLFGALDKRAGQLSEDA